MKKIISSFLSALLMAFSVSAATLTNVTAADKNGKISAELSDYMESSNEESFCVWVWLSDGDKPDFNALMLEEIRPKTEAEAEKYYSLSEEERTELESSTRLKFVKEYYVSKNQEFLANAGISSESVKFTSELTPSMVLVLNTEQIAAIKKIDVVKSIEMYDEESFNQAAATSTDKLTKEQFLDKVISDKEDFSDSGFIYRGNLKFDALPNGDGFDLIVYGIKKEDYKPIGNLSESVLAFDTKNYKVSTTPSFYSGCVFSVAPDESTGLKNDFSVIFYVENVLPGFPEPAVNIIEASLYKKSEIASYIYPEITKGDVDGNGKIDASDASMILVAYSYFSTGKTPALNYEQFDYNGDGKIDASDASDVLVKYAELSTTIS